MSFNEYQAKALSTAKPLPMAVDLKHAGLGLISEVGEICDALKAHMIYDKPIDVVNIKEEIGDGLWFSALLARLLRFNFTELVDAVGSVAGSNKEHLIEYAFTAADAAAAISVRMERFVDHEQPFELSAIASQLRRYMTGLARIGAVFNITLDEAAAANLRKLEVRYQGKAFTPGAGVKRDKAAERAAVG